MRAAARRAPSSLERTSATSDDMFSLVGALRGAPAVSYVCSVGAHAIDAMFPTQALAGADPANALNEEKALGAAAFSCLWLLGARVLVRGPCETGRRRVLLFAGSTDSSAEVRGACCSTTTPSCPWTARKLDAAARDALVPATVQRGERAAAGTHTSENSENQSRTEERPECRIVEGG